MSKPVFLTGLRANNDLHIGNYFGALLPIIDTAKTKADQFQINLFVPDLHSFTTPIDHNQLYSQTIHNLKLYVAAGLPLDKDDVYIYRQSFIPAHSELTWILACFTGMGEMNRMTQFKEKSAKLCSDRVSVGLFSYPILMAADILLYQATYVPVGEDQTQHLEFARDIAERFNKQFGELLVVPKPVSEQHKFFGKDQGLRIKDLQDPTKKMSKSDQSQKGIIFLNDKPADAANKIRGATTDSVNQINFDQLKQPGVSNLLQILALLRNQTIDETTHQFAGQTNYSTFKETVAQEVESFLINFQQLLSTVDEVALTQKLEKDEKQMKSAADQTLLAVQKAVGLRR